MSKQNYKIFLNRSSISLVVGEVDYPVGISVAEFKNLVNKCLAKSQADSEWEQHFQVKTTSPKKVMENIKKELKYIQAAGGILEQNNQYLFIERFGFWDLPKGKVEKGEDIRDAAVREVEEECGVEKAYIVKDLPSTFHIYLFEGKTAIKETFWFMMKSRQNIQNLKPQTEEGITDVRFLPKDYLLQKGVKTYNTLLHLMAEVKLYKTNLGKA